MTGAITLGNDVYLIGKQVDGTPQILITMGSDNAVYAGSTQNPLKLQSNGTHTINGATIWTAANDGSGSGLDADLVKGYVPVNKAGDTVSGNIALNNNTSLQGKTTGGTNRVLAVMGGDDRVYLGDVNQTIRIQAAGHDVQFFDGSTALSAWHTGLLRDNASVLELFTGGAWKPVGGVKSVQRGVISNADMVTTTDVTISSVNTAKAFVNLITTITNRGDGTAVYGNFSLELVAATTLRFHHPAFTAGTFVVRYEVVESY